MKRSLTLKKETLASLTPDEMAAIAGADPSGATCNVSCTTCALTPAVSASYLSPTNCCHTIPTFHVGAAAC